MTALGETARTTDLVVKGIGFEADGVLSFDLRAPDGRELAGFTAGAHVDVVLPGGLERSYSLCNDPAERHRYMIAVQREADSRGGSAHLCDRVRPGDLLAVTAPTNTFELSPTGACVLVAGGIGITPLWSMIQHLETVGRSWTLHYAAGTRRRAAFLHDIERLERVSPGRVHMAFGDEAGHLGLAAILAEMPVAAHAYCCGPARMLKAFETAATHLPGDQVHVEYFASDQAVAKGGFEVVLARSGTSLWIPGDKTILETLLAAGLTVPRSCMEGVCGTCETGVLEGLPDHRDNVLSRREREQNKRMMICRSGCLGDRLVLDL